MKKQEKQVIEEVIEAMNMHIEVVQNTLGTRISKTTLRDIELGMIISVDKLEKLIKV